MSSILLVAILAVPTYFLWSFLHETSHLLAYFATTKVYKWRMKFWPHIDNGRLRFGALRVQCDYISLQREWGIGLAPRMLGGLACVAFALCAQWLGGLGLAAVGTVACGGVVDTLFGSIGWSDRSDVVKAARSLGVDPWAIRIPGIMVAAASVVAFVLGVMT